MNDVEKAPQMKLSEMLALPKHKVQVDMTDENPVYKAYLAANRALEQAREQYGYVPADSLERLRKAVADLDREALNLMAGDRNHG